MRCEARCGAHRRCNCGPLLQAALGGSPSRLGLVQAFLRVKERDRGALDFDQAGLGGRSHGAAELPLPLAPPPRISVPALSARCRAGHLDVPLGRVVALPRFSPRWSHAVRSARHVQPGGVDTTWMRLYCCLRAGFHAEAVQVGWARGTQARVWHGRCMRGWEGRRLLCTGQQREHCHSRLAVL